MWSCLKGASTHRHAEPEPLRVPFSMPGTLPVYRHWITRWVAATFSHFRRGPEDFTPAVHYSTVALPLMHRTNARLRSERSWCPQVSGGGSGQHAPRTSRLGHSDAVRGLLGWFWPHFSRWYPSGLFCITVSEFPASTFCGQTETSMILAELTQTKGIKIKLLMGVAVTYYIYPHIVITSFI